MRDVTKLHKCRSLEEYEQLLDATVSKWLFEFELPEFCKYFRKQWVDSKFNKWQIFRMPAGIKCLILVFHITNIFGLS